MSTSPFPLRTVYLTIELSPEECAQLSELLAAGMAHYTTCVHLHSAEREAFQRLRLRIVRALILPADTLPKAGTAAISLD